ncbi:NAD(P)H-hydrate dehydratase, partial [Blastomonas sp.]|uniref:NAD(P)H-hydrate dehydratase n=1 Tax=Blastomonas sp. TaxID=1909299 RepID=UPI0035935BDE
MPDRGEPVVTVAQMVAAEQALFDAGTSVDALMTRAGQGAGELIWRIGGLTPTLILCGPGNNGGDGYVIAEFLRTKGVRATVAATHPSATHAARNACAAFQGDIIAIADATACPQVVDCVFGSGLSRPVDEPLWSLVCKLVSGARRSFAVDLPSGVDADRAMWLNDALRFDHVIALGAYKYAHLLEPTASDCGTLSLIDIGVDVSRHCVRRLAKPLIAAPDTTSHKYTRGLVAIIAGAMPGAALLAAEAAQATGAGYVKLIGRGAAPANLPAAVVWQSADDGTALAATLADPRIGAVLIGPGLGRDGGVDAVLKVALACPHPLVIDADALHLLAQRGAALSDRAKPVLLTPHHGEFTALVGEMTEACNKAERTRAAARTIGAHLVYKGADSIMAAPDGNCIIADRRCGWLSVAGSGDVLAGAIAARLAAHGDPMNAMAEASWLHDRAARLAGPAFSATRLAA